jgi:hypothetical protein
MSARIYSFFEPPIKGENGNFRYVCKLCKDEGILGKDNQPKSFSALPCNFLLLLFPAIYFQLREDEWEFSYSLIVFR